MSASQEKRKRKEERIDGGELKQTRKKKAMNTKRRNSIIKSVIAVVVVLLLLAAVVYNSALFYSGIPALKLGGWSFKTAEFNYYYKQMYYNTYSNFYSQYGDYASLFLDPSTPLDKQEYYEGQSWADYFEEQALTRMRNIAALYDEGKREGFVLSEEGFAEIEDSLAALRSQAVEAGYSLNDFIATSYSKGLNEKMLRKLVETEVYANYYGDELLARQEFSDQQLLDRYNESKAEYNLVTYCSYFVDSANFTEDGLDTDAAMSAAFNAANELATARTEDVFADMVREIAPESEKENYADPSAVTTLNAAPANFSSQPFADWLRADERQYGDTTVVESGNGYYAVLFVYSNDNSYKLQNFRHVLFLAAVDENYGEVTPATIYDAEQKARAAFELWQQDPTEDNFAAIANDQSEDTGSNTNGGLYENQYMGVLVPEIEQWLFDPERTPGDTDVIYVKSANYTGWHVVYYQGSGEQYNLRIAENLKKQEWFSDWLDERLDQYRISKTIAFNFAK